MGRESFPPASGAGVLDYGRNVCYCAFAYSDFTLSAKMKWKSMWTDFVLGGIATAGLSLFLHHLTFYDMSWHWAFADHGLYGFIMLVFSVGVLIWRHKPKRG